MTEEVQFAEHVSEASVCLFIIFLHSRNLTNIYVSSMDVNHCSTGRKLVILVQLCGLDSNTGCLEEKTKQNSLFKQDFIRRGIEQKCFLVTSSVFVPLAEHLDTRCC